jgi:hypothetical protein
MELPTSADERAQWLLERMRATPMRRGGLSKRARQIKLDLSRAISAQRVPSVLAHRVASQLALKFNRRELHDEQTWCAVGRILQREFVALQERLGMSGPRIVAALPKLSASQIIEFLDELAKTDRRIARTILHAAVNTSDPLATGRRYLAEYRLVARQLRAIDPTMARTVAAATFSAGAPLNKAMEHLQRFSALLKKYQQDPQMARRLARAGYRARPAG